MFKKLTIPILIVLIPFNVFAQEINEKDVFLTAKNAYDEESYGVALDLFNKFIEQFPESQALPEAQLYTAQCFFQKERFIEARDILAKLEKSHVPYGIEDRFLFWSGQAYFKVKDFKQAADYFRKMIETHPDSNLTIAANMQLGEVLLNNGKYQEARDIFDVLTKSRDLSVQEEAFFKKGEALLSMKDYKGTLDNYSLFSKIFFDSDKLAKAYFYLGQASFYLEDFSKATEYYSKAQEKSSDDLLKIMSLQGMGWSYLKQNKLKEAEEGFSKIDKFPNQDFNKESIFFGKATLYRQLNRLEDAIIYYDKLIVTYPQSDMVTEALFGKAECLNELSRFEQAIGVYKEFIDSATKMNNSTLQGTMDKAYYGLGWAYSKVGNLKEAIKEFQNALFLTDDKELKLSTLYQMAEIYQNTEEFDKAQEIYSKILKEYPASAYNDYVLYQLGIAQLRAGMVDSAILTFKDFNKNFAQSGLLGNVNYYLGYAYFKKNNMQEACQQFQSFLGAFPDSVYRDIATYLLAVSFYNRGMFKDAIDNFQKILREFRQNKDLVEKSEYEIANALYQMGEEKLAVKRFRQFIDNYPKSTIVPDIIFWLGQYYYGNSEYELSRRNFEMIIRMYPKYNLAQEAKYEIGLTFLAEDKTESAMQTFKRLLEDCNSRSVMIKTMLAVGDLLSEQNKEKEAIQMYKDLINLASTNNKFNSSGSSLSTEENNGNGRQGILLDSSSETTRTEKSIIPVGRSIGEKNEGNSINEFVKIAYMKLANLYKKQKNFTEAINAYREAMKYFSNNSNAEIQFKIADCLEEGQSLDAAIEEYLKIPNFSKEDETWVVKGLLRVARIYEDKEDWQKTLTTYQNIIKYDVPEVKYAKDKIGQINKQIQNESFFKANTHKNP